MKSQDQINEHVKRLLACNACPQMGKPVVSGGAVLSRVILVGQAPGPKEPLMGRPFAWTAGKTLFRWFQESAGVDEAIFRKKVYMAAVCRCFPGKNVKGAGDRVPDEREILACSQWMKAEFEILQPQLVIAVGKLAIQQFRTFQKLDEIIGHVLPTERFGQTFDLLPLPHPSGASVWHRVEPGKTLLKKSLKLLAEHPVFQKTIKN